MATKRKVARKATKRAAPAAATRTIPETVQTMLNGQVTGSVPNTGTIGDAAYKIAKDNGLKSYAILVDGVKIGTSEASNPLKGHSSVEVFAKETRG